MSEAAPETPATEPKGEDAPEPQADEKKFSQADLDRIISGRLAKYADYDDVKAKAQALEDASATETERAVKQARREAETETSQKWGTRLARSAFDAAAGRRNPDFNTDEALEYVDLSKFVGADGEPDAAAIKAAVERLVPAPADGPPSFDGGARSTAKTTDFNQVLRQAAGRA